MTSKSIILTTTTIATFTTLILGNSSSALASLIGDTVTACATFVSDGCPPPMFSSGFQESAVVGDNQEFNNGTFGIDVQDSMFVLSLVSASSEPFIFNPTLWILSDLDWVDQPGMIIGVESTEGVPSETDIQFTADSVTVTLPEITLPGSVLQEYKFNLQTKHTPEPVSSIGIFTLGILGLGVSLNRKLKK